MKKLFSILSFTLISFLFSCNNKETKKVSSDKTSLSSTPDGAGLSLQKNERETVNGQLNAISYDLEEQQPPDQPKDFFSKSDSAVNKRQAAVMSTIDWDKKIIKTATVKIEVTDFKKYGKSSRGMIKKYGAYIANEQQDIQEGKSETTMSIKVPVAQFEDLMNELTSGDEKIVERKITTDDVSTEFFDTRARLEAKKQMRLKYLDFLKQSKNMEEVLQVQKEINSIQEELEAASGRLNYLSQQSSFSTVDLTFYQPLAGFNVPDKTPSFFTKVTDAFASGGKWLANVFVGIVSIWPLALLIFFGIFIFKRKRSLVVASPAQTNKS